MGEKPTEPGWYDDPAGESTHQAYWDGENWTGETRWPGQVEGRAARSRLSAAGIALLLVGILVLLAGMYQDDVVGKRTNLGDIGIAIAGLGLWTAFAGPTVEKTFRLVRIGSPFRRRQGALLLAGWLLFGLALALPALMIPAEASFAEPRQPGVLVGLFILFGQVDVGLYGTVSLATNLSMVASLRYWDSRFRYWNGAALIAGAAFNLGWLGNLTALSSRAISEALVGYWTWIASFVLVAVALLLPIDRHKG